MFADSGLSDELAEKIVAFVDREAGRDAPLSDDDEAMVRRMIADDPAVRALVDDLRATNVGLDTLLDDVAAVEVPDRLVALIQAHGTSEVAIVEPRLEENDEAADEAEIVAFPEPAPRRISYGPLAAAASIALLISSGALYYLYSTSNAERERLQSVLASASEDADSQGRALADARAELERLSGLAERASERRRDAADRLLANEETIQQLEVERAALEGRFAVLEGENQQLSARLGQQHSEMAASEAARERIAADLANAQNALAAAETEATEARATLTADIQNLAAELEQREQDVAGLTDQLEAGQQRSEMAETSLAEARSERAALGRDLAELRSEREQLLAQRRTIEQAAAEAEQRLASLEAEVEDASSRLSTVTAGLTSAEAGRREALQQVVGLEAELAASRSWLGQIAQYHRVYASTARRHLVEVGADQIDHIQTWLTTMVGRPILVPDLTGFGVIFAGARLLAINDQPVAQLVYLDTDNQPLALCVIPSSGEAKDPTLSRNGDLNLVDWRDGDFGYAVVGWSAPELLASLTTAIRPVYDL